MVTLQASEFFGEELKFNMVEYKEELEQLQFKGRLISYSLSEDLEHLWMTCLAEGESELLNMINGISFTDMMTFDYHELIYQESIYHLPALSLN